MPGHPGSSGAAPLHQGQRTTSPSPRSTAVTMRARAPPGGVAEPAQREREVVLEEVDAAVRHRRRPIGARMPGDADLGRLVLEEAEVGERLVQLVEPVRFGEVVGELAQSARIAARPGPLVPRVGPEAEVVGQRGVAPGSLLACEVLAGRCLAQLAVVEGEQGRAVGAVLGQVRLEVEVEARPGDHRQSIHLRRPRGAGPEVPPHFVVGREQGRISSSESPWREAAR